MIPCPTLPLFIYGYLKTPIKLILLAGQIEKAMNAQLNSYRLTNFESLTKTDNPSDCVFGEILWINTKKYTQLIESIDNLGKVNPKHPYSRFQCDPMTNETIDNGRPKINIKCWSYK
jgi:hypothetical protein